jgi:hypothetical protein
MKYNIKPGHSFRDSDNSVKTSGVIELPDDVAATHGYTEADAVADTEAAPVQTSALAGGSIGADEQAS